MTVKFFLSAITKFLLGVALVGLLIFLPAGSVSYFNGWLLVGILFIPMFFAGLVMMFKNPDLLKSRLDAKEKQKEQNLVVKLSGLMFIAGFIVSGLGVRFGWYVYRKVLQSLGLSCFLLLMFFMLRCFAKIHTSVAL